MRGVKIPVRDGWGWGPRVKGTRVTERGQQMYVEGWGWGVVCGMVAGTVLTLLGVVLGHWMLRG